jgi:hypothetical protein
MINTELELTQKNLKTWVEKRLADSATLLSVPNVISGTARKINNCQFRSFEEFVRHTLKKLEAEADYFSAVDKKIADLKKELEQIPLVEGRLIEYF